MDTEKGPDTLKSDVAPEKAEADSLAEHLPHGHALLGTPPADAGHLHIFSGFELGEDALSLEGLLSDSSDLEELLNSQLSYQIDREGGIVSLDISASEDLDCQQEHVVVQITNMSDYSSLDDSTILQQLILLHGG